MGANHAKAAGIRTPLRSLQNLISLSIEAARVFLPGGELLKGLLGVLASSGHRGGKVGDGRAGHKGLDGRADGGGADAASDTEEGGHCGREELVSWGKSGDGSSKGRFRGL